MNNSDRNARSRVRRVLTYVSTLLAISGLVAVALVTFVPSPTPAGNGSLPPRQGSSQTALTPAWYIRHPPQAQAKSHSELKHA